MLKRVKKKPGGGRRQQVQEMLKEHTSENGSDAGIDVDSRPDAKPVAPDVVDRDAEPEGPILPLTRCAYSRTLLYTLFADYRPHSLDNALLAVLRNTLYM